MAITAVGGPNPAVLTQLQKQLAEDEQTLTNDVKAKASQKTLTLDQAKITLDAAAIAAEQVKELQQAQQAQQAEQTQQAAHAAGQIATSPAGASTAADGSIDKYL